MGPTHGCETDSAHVAAAVRLHGDTPNPRGMLSTMAQLPSRPFDMAPRQGRDGDGPLYVAVVEEVRHRVLVDALDCGRTVAYDERHLARYRSGRALALLDNARTSLVVAVRRSTRARGFVYIAPYSIALVVILERAVELAREWVINARSGHVCMCPAHAEREKNQGEEREQSQPSDHRESLLWNISRMHSSGESGGLGRAIARSNQGRPSRRHCRR